MQITCGYQRHCGYHHIILWLNRYSVYPNPSWVQVLWVQVQCENFWPMIYLCQTLSMGPSVFLKNGHIFYCSRFAMKGGYRNREGEGGARVVSSGGGWLAFCSHGCSRLCLHGDPFMGENAHGMPFEAIPLAPSHAVSSEKGSHVDWLWSGSVRVRALFSWTRTLTTRFGPED